MGSIIACVCCYCCLMTVKPKVIEIIALICNIIEIAFLAWGIADIPWDDVSKGGKITFYIGCAFVILTLLFLIVLMCLRCGNKINTTKNSTGKCICVSEVVFDFFALLLIIIGEAIIIYDMDDHDYYEYDDYGYRRRRRRNSIYSDGEWAAAVVSTIIAEIAIVVHGYCVSFLLKLIYLKTSLSYLKYQESLEPENNSIGRTIGIFNSPPANNELKFLGYDQNGHPIYSGNTQYFTQQPVITNANNTNNVNGKK